MVWQRLEHVRCVLQIHLHLTSVSRRTDPSREAPGLQTEASREAGASHGTLNGTIDHDKDARRVFFLVRKRMMQVEEPAQGNIASLTHSRIANEGRSHLDKRRFALVEQTEKPS
jgi:hypothetical protein